MMSQAEIAALPPLIEGYYAKAIIELGLLGLFIVLAIMVSITVYALGIHRATRDPMARSCSAAITGFVIIMAVHSFKGWQVDLDPINVWYWVLVGLLFRLPELRFDKLAEARRQAELEKNQTGKKRPHRKMQPGRAPPRHRVR